MANLHADVSEHQGWPIDSSYDLKFFMFRLVNEFGHVDKLAAENLRRSVALRKQGKLTNFGGYADAGHVNNATFLDAIDNLGFPRDAVLMNDAEPWPGEGPNGGPLISGDHSAVHNDLVTKARARQSGRADLVWGYLGYYNQGLWSDRLDWLGMVMPWYGRASKPPDYGHLIGHQFTDGAPGNNATTYRDSTPPFGRVDHNVMFIDYPTPGGTDMPLDHQDKTWLLDNLATKPQISALHKHLLGELATDDQVHASAVQSAARDTALAGRLDSNQAELISDISQIVAAGGDPTAVAEAVVSRIGQILQGAA